MAILNRKKRIMHIISGDLWAGAEAQCFTLISELKNTNDLKVVLMNFGELASKLEAIGVDAIVIDEQKNSSFQILLDLRKLLLNFRPDLIHTHRQKENILGNIANLFSVNAKSVRTTHGASEFSPSLTRRLQNLFDNLVGRYLQQAIISVSKDLSKKLALSFPKKKIHTIINGVNVPRLQDAKPAPDITATAILNVGIIGRLEPVKRVDIFLQVAAMAAKTTHPLHLCAFHIIGDGKLRNELEQMAQDLKIYNTTTFHGHRSDIASCIKALDAIIMCSDHEGTPMTALESLALSTPLIAHNVGGLSEILSHSPQFLVDSHTAEGYANALIQALDLKLSPTLPASYTAEYNASQINALYSSLISH